MMRQRGRGKKEREKTSTENKKKKDKKTREENAVIHTARGGGCERLGENREGERARGNMFRDSLYGREKGESDSVLFLAYSPAVFDKRRWMDGWMGEGSFIVRGGGEHQSRKSVSYFPVFLGLCVCVCVCVCVFVCMCFY